MKTLEHILLVDDNDEDNEFHEIVIRDAGIAKQVTVISDAAKAIDFFKASLRDAASAANFPELIFLDIMMPRIDGFELLNKLKLLLAESKAEIRKPKVFILSGAYNPVIEVYLNSPNYEDLVPGYRLKPLTKTMLTEIAEKYF